MRSQFKQRSVLKRIRYLQLIVPGPLGVIGHHVPKLVGMESVKDPEEYKHLLKMVDPDVKDQQGRLKTVMNKIVQVNKGSIAYIFKIIKENARDVSTLQWTEISQNANFALTNAKNYFAKNLVRNLNF